MPDSLCVMLIKSLLFSSQVRLQTQPKPKPGESLLYSGTIDCFKKTLAKEVRRHVAVVSGKSLSRMSPPSWWCFPIIFIPHRVWKDSIKAWQPPSLESHPCLLSVSSDSGWARSYNRRPLIKSWRRWQLCHRWCCCCWLNCSRDDYVKINCLLQISSVVCCGDVVWCVHHGHHGSRRANQVPPAGQRFCVLQMFRI